MFLWYLKGQNTSDNEVDLLLLLLLLLLLAAAAC